MWAIVSSGDGIYQLSSQAERRKDAEHNASAMARREGPRQCFGLNCNVREFYPKWHSRSEKFSLRPSSCRHGGRFEQLRMQIGSTLVALVFFYLNAVGVGVSIVPDAGHLPAHLHMWAVGPDGKAVVLDLARDDGLRELSDDGQLIAEVLVEGLEPVGQGHGGVAARVGGDVAVVDVHHVGGFDEGVRKIFVGRVEGMVNLERAAALGEVADHVYAAALVNEHAVDKVGVKIQAELLRAGTASALGSNGFARQRPN